MPISKGATVRQVVPVIEGEVIDRRFDEASEGMSYLVSYTDADGETHQRWFAEADLEVA